MRELQRGIKRGRRGGGGTNCLEWEIEGAWMVLVVNFESKMRILY